MGTWHLGLKKLAFPALAVIAPLAVSAVAWAQGDGMRWNGSHTTIHGNPPSVTSFGFGGQPGFHGVPASVTSPNFGNTPFPFNQHFHQRPFFARHHHHNPGFANPFYGNIVAVPYAYPVYLSEPGVDDSMEEEDYRGGPTIFDRRGPGTQEYYRPERRDREERGRDERDRNEEDYRARRPAEPAPAQPAPQAEVANQPHTVLVFKDGRRLEIVNYAIVGSTLFDLSDGLTRKVALAELDLPATVKQNDDRGVEFQLPAGSKSN
jgi:hypothetical protein